MKYFSPVAEREDLYESPYYIAFCSLKQSLVLVNVLNVKASKVNLFQLLALSTCIVYKYEIYFH